MIYKVYILGLQATKVVSHLEKKGYTNINYSFKDNCYLAYK